MSLFDITVAFSDRKDSNKKLFLFVHRLINPFQQQII